MTIIAMTFAVFAAAMGTINGFISARHPDATTRVRTEYAAIGWFAVSALFLMVAK